MDGLFKIVLLLAAVPALLLFLKIFLPPVLHRMDGWRLHFALKSALPTAYYTLLSNIRLNTGRGEVHLDHVLVSPYGVFVIEACHLWGGISGASDRTWWSRRLFFSRLEFRNPLQKAMANIELLQDLLGLEAHQFHALVVFSSYATLKPGLPVNVTGMVGMLPFIQVRTERLIEYEEADRIAQLLQAGRLRPRRGTTASPAGSIKARYQRVSGPVGALAGIIFMAGLLHLGSSVLEGITGGNANTDVTMEESDAGQDLFVNNAPPPKIDLPAVADQHPVMKTGSAAAEAETNNTLPQ